MAAADMPIPSPASSYSFSSNPPSLFEVRLRLITGRTHQIRLQLSAAGAPLVGDTRYIPVAGMLDDTDDTDAEGEQHGNGSALFGPEPDRIGLHCESTSYGADWQQRGLPPPAASRVPWWRQ